MLVWRVSPAAPSLKTRTFGLGIDALVEGGPDIERLNVLGCPNVDNELFAKIAECCKILKCFSSDSDEVSDTGIVEFVDSCPLLRDLDVKGCGENVTKATKAWIELMCASRR